ncbi:uncharacterized protein LY89DRAFT_637378 [Mollisia scopiformis]|uniref:histidine kinase n=1 Tax=Mollisia scopiformis TaxID=149040 RepID=A0A194XN51_MOLSC|nr:uncharacterized protein LY89DRAFT_637378 [Mollisia scopiformis]KUJ21566.1 hypothetical protein LY89DRAFT_637378 [Mollisia scopiformis]
MAPVASTVEMAMSHIEGVTDNARARELYKYYQPSAPINQDTCFPVPPPGSGLPSDAAEEQSDININSDVTSSKISSPDTALTAFCQLTTWRTGAQRAMLSVIDSDTQYFLAESTKTVDLLDNNNYAPGDGIWMGCATVTKPGRLCERTIAVTPAKPGNYPCFIVDDLSKDERFNTLPFVTGPPFLRFYAGVPLITKRGIPIGSLFVVDDRVGKGLSEDKIHFMGTMAGTIMRHMEMVREVEQHRRGMKMSRGLASFVEGRAELAEAETDADDTEGAKVVGQFETESSVRTRSKGSTVGSYTSAVGSIHSIEQKEKEYSAALAKTEHIIQETHEVFQSPGPRPDIEEMSQSTSFTAPSTKILSPNDTYDKTSSPGDDLSETTSMKMLFSRSANLIREAFEVDGGAVFYDAQTGFSSNMKRASAGGSSAQDDSFPDSAPDSHASGDDLHSSNEIGSDAEAKQSPLTPMLSPRTTSPGLGDGGFSRSTIDNQKLVEILGFSTPEASSIHGDPLPGPQSFIPFVEKSLHVLLRRYPRGKLWTFDTDGAVSSSSEEEPVKPLSLDPLQRSKDAHRRKARSKRTKSDALFLSRQFPGVRQLLFVPLWDASRSRWLSGCFVWSTEPTRILSKQNELSFLTAFGNSVMAEWARIDTEIADQKKSDFIGSISHELRSPLHGILASAEFLAEDTTGWAKGLVNTIDSCGRTLLDTINHILDYSKINHFEKNWRRSKRADRRPRHGSNMGSLSLRQSDLPMLNLYQTIDISILCEEVVDSVFSGHIFQHTTAESFDMVPGSRDKMSDATKKSSLDEMLGPQRYNYLGVVVILDVDMQNYRYHTQPGAFRRLVMNLLGNALKYTSHGYVYIKLEAVEIADLDTAPSTPSNTSSNESMPRSMITLTVADTGKGISAEFLRSKLFTPFAQENSLSSGTGLGLSIVRKIVSLLEGDIKIDSEVGRGTRVQVTLPMLREMPTTTDSSSSASTNKSLITATHETDHTITELRSRVIGQKASLYGFDNDTKDAILQDMYRVLKAAITSCLVKWYGMKIVPLGQKTNVIVCNESKPSDLESLVAHIPKQKINPAIVVLCAHDTRFDHTPHLEGSKCNVSYVAKPVGPLKLAKAITACLDGVPPSMTPGIDSSLSHSPENVDRDLSSTFDSLMVSPRGGEVLDNTRMSADSENARKAIESPTPSAIVEKNAEFPFPQSLPELNDKPEMSHGSTMPATKGSLNPSAASSSQAASTTLSKMKNVTAKLQKSVAKVESPTFLLVDDNHINMKLLSTYINRRNFEIVHQAQNGLEAVKQVQARPEGYDIIFMDITMPVLDGFGATSQIRAIEESRRRKAVETEGEKSSPPPKSEEGSGGSVPARKSALVIAFTGRSSMEDQAEAMRVGVDLFMIKPVAFSEVGKMIDNWMANRGRQETQ